MRVIDQDYLTEAMQDENAFILRCEEWFSDKISAAAATILTAKDHGRNIVCLTGPSGSGKTTTANRLKDYLENLTVPVTMISMDNFFLPTRLRKKEIQSDWESPLAVDAERLIQTVENLSLGQSVEMPTFDFVHDEFGPTYTEQLGENGVLIIEGIHMLNPLIFNPLSDKSIGVYASPRTRVLTHDEKVIHPQIMRIARRMLRDYATRGRSFTQTIQRAQDVNLGEEKYIHPYRSNAEIHLDTFHDYEPCLLATSLLAIPAFHTELTSELLEEYHLTDLVNLFKTLPHFKTRYIPKDSILREFIGGSRYEY